MAKHFHITRRDAFRQGTVAALGIFSGYGRAAGTSDPEVLSEFGYGDVQLAPGPLQQQFDQNREILLNLSEDSLLRPYRLREGLAAPGQDMGGWYDTDAFAPGFTYGQWMSALARYYAASGDPACREKVSRMVRGFAGTIHPEGRFYLENRFPSYIYDKLVCGLIDAYKYANDPLALPTLSRATDAAWKHLPPKAIPHWEAPVDHGEDFTLHAWDESYTLSENQFLAYQRGGDPRHLELAKRLLFNDEFFNPLAKGENVLPGKHAYSHVNSLSSAAQAYLVLGDPKYLATIKNGFDFVRQQSYATGGWGPDEHFVVPGSGKLGESLENTHSTFETPCGAYAHFKIARYLTRITKNPMYGDTMERVLYNTVLGATPIQPDGSTFYYSDYNFEGKKTFFGDKWPCCSGTLPQIAADYRISAYFRGARGVYVNLYTPSTVTWTAPGAKFSMRQITEYPYDRFIRADVSASRPETFSVFLRIPEWAEGANLSLNGMRDSRKLAAGTFAEVRREWKNGDRVELELPLKMRLEAIDAQHPNTVALVSGPVAWMALRGASLRLGDITRKELLTAQPEWPGSRTWIAGDLKLRAFPDIQDEPYTTYLRVG
ncbi:MAG TPA: beta-L-arabinofuranosidase domain-containing protein [Bryobacteraceae bacterium]|nr:beta-L-arabinofuranosidase domain-containing protein [Bryobacteraceae bacterium]